MTAPQLPSVFGLDVNCVIDADAAWTEVTGIPLVVQDVFHRITTTDILSVADPGTDEANACIGWGLDCRQMLGMDPIAAVAMGPQFEAVILRDARISSATVTIVIASVGPGGVTAATMTVTCTTALGPFVFIVSLPQLTLQILQGQTN